MREQIEERIREYLADSDPRLAWVREAARKYNFLPLYLGWVATLAIQPDGALVEWRHEDDPGRIHPLTDPYWHRIALCQGARRYPELAALIPRRPVNASTCPTCKGKGSIDSMPEIICQCGGLGWIVPGEEHGPAPG